MTLAPLVVRDLGIIGSAGGEYGIRGWIDATDLNTGKQAWRTYTIPGKGEPGNETWKDGQDHWMHGGGSVWVTATYDNDTDTIYQGIGNAGPDYDPEYRPGDNKWAASVLALDPGTGKIKWGFQYTPNDPYDYDEISEHQIIDAVVNGESRKLVVHGARNGFYYAFDRTNGAFVAGKQYVDELTWSRGLDPKTGKPLEYDPTKDVQPYVEGSHATRAKPSGTRCPATAGGKNWEPAAYNPELKLIYIPSSEGCSEINLTVQKDFVDQGGPVKPRDRFDGGGNKRLKQTTGSRQGARSGDRRDQGGGPHRSAELVRRAGDRRQSGVHRPVGGRAGGLRRAHPQGGLALRHRLRRDGAADQLRGQRQAIHRGGGRPALARRRGRWGCSSPMRARCSTCSRCDAAGWKDWFGSTSLC